MKITLDIPDTTVCAFFDFVYAGDFSYFMKSQQIGTEVLYDGSVITINTEREDESE